MLAAALLVVFAGVTAFQAWRMADWSQDSERAAAADRRQRTIATTRVLRDEQGRMTEISGSDPRHVLLAYCSSEQGAARRKPLEVAHSVPLEANVRLGIFTDPTEHGARYAIRIRKEGGARRWVAGGDGEPIAVAKAPRLPPGTPRIPVGS